MAWILDWTIPTVTGFEWQRMSRTPEDRRSRVVGIAAGRFPENAMIDELNAPDPEDATTDEGD